MADSTIYDLPNLPSPADDDKIPIYDDSGGVTSHIKYSDLFKAIKDSGFILQDNSDTSKQAKFEASGITAGQTRTYTLPDGDTTLVGTGLTQTLTNKTLTSPVINTPTGIVKGDVGLGNVDNTSDATKNSASATLTNKTLTSPVINNPTLNVDTISEFTATNGVNVDGLNIKDGKLNTNNSVVESNITNEVISNAKLKTGSDEPGGVWDDWTPTLTNLSGGTLTYAKYKRVGKTVHFALKYVLAGAGVSGSPEFTPPVSMATRYTNNRDIIDASVQLFDANGNRYPGYVALGNPGTMVIFGAGAGSSAYIAIGSTNPFTWASGDSISVAGTYEAA